MNIMENDHPPINYRRALEALRNGVPNRDAVSVLGCNQRRVETAFLEKLEAVGALARKGKQVPGLLFEGGFGSGKSHLLDYLEHLSMLVWISYRSQPKLTWKEFSPSSLTCILVESRFRIVMNSRVFDLDWIHMNFQVI